MFRICALSLRSVSTNGQCFHLSVLRIVAKRYFYSEQELGVDKIQRMRRQIQDQFEKKKEIHSRKRNITEKFPNLTIKEKRVQLKEFVLLFDNKQEDLKDLKSILVQYRDASTVTDDDNENGNNNATEFCFGTSIMRTFYLLNLPESAIEFYNDEQTRNLFEQMDTYKVMLTLLHNNKRYEETFKFYDMIRKHLELYNQYPHPSINCLAFSACYHLNTEEHYAYARDLYERVQHIRILIRRARHLLAGLALKQNDPSVALSVLEEKEFHIGARFIRLMAFTQSHRFNCAFAVLQQTIDSYKNNGNMMNKPLYGSRVITDLRKAIVESGTEDQLKEFDKIYEELKSLNLLNNNTLDQLLCAKFSTKHLVKLNEVFLIDRKR